MNAVPGVNIPPGLLVPNGHTIGHGTDTGAGQSTADEWWANRVGEYKRNLSGTNAGAPNFGAQHCDMADTPPKRSPEDGGSQNTGPFPGLSPRTAAAMAGIASAFAGNNQNTAPAPALPASLGAYAPDDAANNFHRQTQVIATVPVFHKLNTLEQWGAAVCRCLVAAAGYHGHREISWFMEVTRKTYDQLDDPCVE